MPEVERRAHQHQLAQLRGLLDIGRALRAGGELEAVLDSVAARFASHGLPHGRDQPAPAGLGRLRGRRGAGLRGPRDSCSATTRASDWEVCSTTASSARRVLHPDGASTGRDDAATYIPDIPPSDDPGAWHADDALLVPLRGAGGDLARRPLHRRARQRAQARPGRARARSPPCATTPPRRSSTRRPRRRPGATAPRSSTCCASPRRSTPAQLGRGVLAAVCAASATRSASARSWCAARGPDRHLRPRARWAGGRGARRTADRDIAEHRAAVRPRAPAGGLRLLTLERGAPRRCPRSSTASTRRDHNGRGPRGVEPPLADRPAPRPRRRGDRRHLGRRPGRPPAADDRAPAGAARVRQPGRRARRVGAPAREHAPSRRARPADRPAQPPRLRERHRRADRRRPRGGRRC